MFFFKCSKEETTSRQLKEEQGAHSHCHLLVILTLFIPSSTLVLQLWTLSDVNSFLDFEMTQTIYLLLAMLSDAGSDFTLVLKVTVPCHTEQKKLIFVILQVFC
ncbi:hypothetical protein EB796_003158 [Bugula neritina]|uniref:Uncharacterized protein n=1 Tax=Bugula neritina TaxID=10212 RepID=A0A7J7JS22_BUGNE|nr:hypothetical protein EB796_012900 [Bugula neritina]KAF6038537.1 hypothetical protein EB796_003158 [Bugula neritina]